MWHLMILAAAFPANMETAPPIRATPLGRAIKFLADYHGSPLKMSRARQLAAHFRKYSRKWSVDPWLAVSVACQESIFRDHPRRIKIRRCRIRIHKGVAMRVCTDEWAGERGIMQVSPMRARMAYRACTGKRLKRMYHMYDTEVSICAGMWLMAYRRDKIRRRARHGRHFMARGTRFQWARHYRPCNQRQRKFCKNGNRDLCRRFWWVASYNWGSHQVVCGPRVNNIDFAGYPIRVLRRYKTIVDRFRPKSPTPASGNGSTVVAQNGTQPTGNRSKPAENAIIAPAERPSGAGNPAPETAPALQAGPLQPPSTTTRP